MGPRHPQYLGATFRQCWPEAFETIDPWMRRVLVVILTSSNEDKDRLAGTGIGAVVGGLLGNRVGGGSGKVLATVAGAAAGGYAGNKIEQKMQDGNTYTTTEQRCVTAYDTREEPNGYEVTYVLDGKEHHVRMDHDPGKQIPVKDGHIVIESDHSHPST